MTGYTDLNNKEAEEAVLVSAILVEENLFELIEEPEQIFYFDVNRTIFRQMQSLYFDGQKIDFIILSACFPRDDEIQSAIRWLASNGYTTINFKGMLNILVELMRKRLIYLKCQDVMQEIPMGKRSAGEIIEDFSEIGESIIVDRTDGSMDMSEFANQEITEIYSEENYTKTGIPALDEKIIGLFKGQMILVSGAPGSGKTTFTFNIIQNINDALFVSLEMTKADLFAKMLAREARVDSKKIEALKMSTEEIRKVNEAKNKIQETCKLTVNDKNMPFTQLKNYIRSMCKKHPYKVIVIDHAQLIMGVRGKDLTEKYTVIANEIKALAKEIMTPIIILVQILKEATRGITAPTMADVRGSGAWIDNADTIMFTYFLGEGMEKQHNIAIAKCKKAEPGKVHDLEFEPQYSNFRSIAPEWESCQPGYFHD